MPRTVRLNRPECAGAIGAELYSACVNQWAALWEFQTKKGPILQRRSEQAVSLNSMYYAALLLGANRWSRYVPYLL